MIVGETPNGKQIQAVREPRGTYKLSFVLGGELPDELAGSFMAERDFQVAVARYLDKANRKKNAERQSWKTV